MGISQYDFAATGRPAWNADKQVGANRALKIRQIWSIRFFLDREGRMRDRALFDLAIDSKLRSRLAHASLVQRYELGRWWSSRKPAGPFNSRLVQTHEQASWRGLNFAAGASTTSHSPAASTPSGI